jgi:hypothetical protein
MRPALRELEELIFNGAQVGREDAFTGRLDAVIHS